MRARRFVAAGVAVLALVAGCSNGDDGSAGAASPSASTGDSFRGSGFAPCPAPTGAAPASGALSGVAALPCMDGSGDTVALGAPTGRPVVLNLWASWCPPCGKELPAFVRLANDAGTRLTVVGVNTSDPDAGRAVAAAGDLDVAFANVYDRDAAVRKALKVNALPATAFVSATGEVVHVYLGTPLTDATLAALVRRYLGVTVE